MKPLKWSLHYLTVLLKTFGVHSPKEECDVFSLGVVKAVGIGQDRTIGGERAKGGHVGCWEGCDWSRKGVTSLCPIRVMSPVKKTGNGSKISKECFILQKGKICLDLRLQAGTWARTECHGGRPYFVTQRRKNKCHGRPARASCSS